MNGVLRVLGSFYVPLFGMPNMQRQENDEQRLSQRMNVHAVVGSLTEIEGGNRF